MARKKKVYSDDFDADLESRYSDYVRTKEKDEEDKIQAISTGSLSLDVSLGVGGIPKRRFTEIYGAESTGKTTLALTISRCAIAGGDSVLYVDAENAIDFTYAEKIIGKDAWDKSKFLVIQPEIMEDALQICEDGIRQKRFGLIVLDSVAAMTPKKVMEETLNDKNPFILANMMKIFVQRNGYHIKMSDIAFVGLNQVRDDTSNTYIRTVVPPGGHAWKHILSVQIELKRASWIKAGDEVIGLDTRYLTRKNKVAPPYRSWSFPIMFGEGIDYLRDAVLFAEHLGVLTMAGAYYTLEGESLGRGLMATIERLRSDKDTLDKIVNMCYNIINTDEEIEEEIVEYEKVSES